MISFKSFFAANPKKSFLDRENKKISFFQNGREALKIGLRYLEIKEGDNILVPCYICKEAIIPFQSTGVRAKYYKIQPNLCPDFNDLELQVDKQTKAVLMVHYFGFPQPVEKFQNFCGKYHLKLIEDCAHTFGGKYSNKYLGTFGDIAFFSIRKIFPLPDGGLLVTPKNAPVPQIPETKTRLRSIAGLLLGRVMFSTGWRWLDLLRKIRISRNNNLNRKDDSDLGIASFSKFLFKKDEWENMVQQRKNNYLYLANLLIKVPEIELLYPELPEGIVPYALPIITKDKKIEELLHQNGVLADPWPELPEELDFKTYKTAFYLSKNILLLPIHQGLNRQKLETIARIVYKHSFKSKNKNELERYV